MNMRKRTGIHLLQEEALREAAAAGDNRPARVSDAQPGCRPRACRRRRRGEERHRPAFAQDRPLTPTFYQWIEDLHPGIPAVNAKFPGINYQIAPVEGFGIERFVAEAKNKESTWDVYVGQTPFVEMSAMIRRRRHRAVGQLHPERRARRHHSLDPRGVHDRRQALWLAVPARRDRHGLAFGPDEQGRAARCGARDLGRLSGQCQEGRGFRARHRSAPPSIRMAGARWRRSPTA